MKEKKASGAAAVGIILLVLFLAFTAALTKVDVASPEPVGMPVGFSGWNLGVRNALGENSLCYTATELLGYFSILVAALSCLVGLFQWITRKKLSKVDKELLIVYGFYVLVVALKVFFDKVVIINYRPILEEGLPAASYPSSHTMLVCTIFGMGIAARFQGFFGTKGLRTAVCWIAGLLIVIMTAGRLLSGVHWLTDIIGSLLLSGAVVAFYTACIRKCRRNEKKK